MFFFLPKLDLLEPSSFVAKHIALLSSDFWYTFFPLYWIKIRSELLGTSVSAGNLSWVKSNAVIHWQNNKPQPEFCLKFGPWFCLCYYSYLWRGKLYLFFCFVPIHRLKFIFRGMQRIKELEGEGRKFTLVLTHVYTLETTFRDHIRIPLEKSDSSLTKALYLIYEEAIIN